MIKTLDFQKSTPDKVVTKKITAKQKAAETFLGILTIALEFSDEQITYIEEMTDREIKEVEKHMTNYFDRLYKVIENGLPN